MYVHMYVSMYFPPPLFSPEAMVLSVIAEGNDGSLMLGPPRGLAPMGPPAWERALALRR